MGNLLGGRKYARLVSLVLIAAITASCTSKKDDNPTPTPTPLSTATPTPPVNGGEPDDSKTETDSERTGQKNENLILNLEVFDSRFASKWNIQKNIRQGSTLYADRAFLVASLPTDYWGSEYIQTANDSKSFTGDVLVTFTVAEDCDVFVAFDTRNGGIPDWLSDFEDTGDSLIDDEASPVTYRLYGKRFAEGETVTLGKNILTSGSICLYTVLVRSVYAPFYVYDPANEAAFGPQRHKFKIGSSVMYLNGIEKPVAGGNISPVYKDNTVLLPYEAMLALSEDVTWSIEGDAITATYLETTVKAQLDSKTLLVNGTEKQLDVAVQKIDGQLYLPAEAFVVNLNCGFIGWDEETATFIITTNATAGTNYVAWENAMSQTDAWYSSTEAIRIANNLLLFQRNFGGWSKNIDMSVQLTEAQIRTLQNEKNNKDSTFDNSATMTQIRYLARVYMATGIEKYKDSFDKAIDAVLNTQYKDNGGWPQYLQDTSNYRAQITFNDNAMVNVLRFLTEIVKNKERYSFVDAATVERMQTAIDKGIQCILNLQIYSEEQKMLTAWCAQYDQRTLKPATARSYELPSISGSESIGIIQYLMDIENPSIEIQNAVHAAVTWFELVEIKGYRHETATGAQYQNGKDRVLVEDSNAVGLWARFYEISTFRPMYVGRDGVIKYDYSEIEYERRNGYSYVGNWGKVLPGLYSGWKQKNGIQ